ncbi:unnamed protein product [Rotaria sordida]|uniref:Uncharacterized protein n=1 Tax=Rotaria sordida TaxID=392033 RepID=A0A814TYC2_9BILA|nr:unnamed protein product [Rotaria sordida]
MKLYVILFTLILLIGFCTSTNQLHARRSLQDYVDSFVNTGKIQLRGGVLKLNDTVIRQIWSFFKAKYRRIYSSNRQEGERLRIFVRHLKYVLKSNFKKTRTYQLGLNQFSDWTLAEFDALKKGLKVSRSLARFYQRHYHARRLKRNLQKHRYNDRRFSDNWFDKVLNQDQHNNDTSSLPKTFDWRTKTVVSPIKSQGGCGSCYAFASVAVLESVYAIKTNSKNVTEFSPQQIVDCSNNGNSGCYGGLFQPTIEYFKEKGGKIATDASYPYVGRTDESCRKDGINEIDLGQIEYIDIPVGDEKQMAEVLINNGPIFIGLDADSELFMFYKSGVLKIDNCPNDREDMDHAMVIVGYGYDEKLKLPYWILKNSWGVKWGESGYLRLIKDADNMCGIATMASYAKLT